MGGVGGGGAGKALVVDQRPWFTSGWALFWATQKPQDREDELTAIWQSRWPGEPKVVFNPTAYDPPFTHLLWHTMLSKREWRWCGGERSVEFSRTEVVKYCHLPFPPSLLVWLTFLSGWDQLLYLQTFLPVSPFGPKVLATGSQAH